MASSYLSDVATAPRPALPSLPPASAALVARAQALTWAEARHAAFPAPGAAADYASFLLAQADESLLWLGVADVPLLNDAAAALLADATAALLDAARRRGDDGVGSLHSYGAEMDVFFPRLLGEIAAAVEPLYRLMFREGAAGVDAAPAAGARARGLVTHSSHAIGYGLEGQRELKLKLHVDDSRLTVNLCLGRPGFTGSELYFTGFQKLRFPPIAAAQRRMPVGAETREVCAPCHSGRALLHLGCHPHRTVKIESGERYNWVLWYHDTEELDAERARREGAGAAPPASAAAFPALARVAAPAEEGAPPQPAWASRTPPPPSPAAET